MLVIAHDINCSLIMFGFQPPSRANFGGMEPPSSKFGRAPPPEDVMVQPGRLQVI